MNHRHPSSQRRRRSTPYYSVGSIATTALVAYGTYRLASWAWGAWRNQKKHPADEEEELRGQHSQRSLGLLGGGGLVPPSTEAAVRTQSPQQQKWRLRRQRLERCREETVSAMRNFLPTLRRAVEEHTNVSQETRALKQLRAAQKTKTRGSNAGGTTERDLPEEKELWDILKVQAVTRMVATAYAHTILFLVLTVQVHLLGGRLLDEQIRTQESTTLSSLGDDSVASDRMSSYQSSHKLVLKQTYEHFFQRGIASLVKTVERAVSDVMSDWDVTDPSSMNTTREMMEDAIQNVRDAIEGRVQGRRRRATSTSRPRSILRFLLPPSDPLAWNAASSDEVPDELAQAILDETWDLLESPVMEDAQRDCLTATFDLMRDKYWGTLFVDENAPRHAADPFVTRPLAHVITQLKHSSSSFFKPPEAPAYAPKPALNIYVSAMERMPAVLELGDVSFN